MPPVQLSASFQSLPSLPTSKWVLVVLIPGWVGLCTFWDLVGLSRELSCEAGSFPCHLNPHRFFWSEILMLYLPALEPWVAWSVSLLSFSSQFIHTEMWNCPVCQPPSCRESSLPWLPFCAPPTGLGECFFFNSLVVRCPYSSIFCHFWLFFVFKFVVVPLLVVGGGTVYLPAPSSWLKVHFLLLKQDLRYHKIPWDLEKRK